MYIVIIVTVYLKKYLKSRKMKILQNNEQRYKNIPITLFPSPIPRKEYYKIVRIQPSINKLMHLISMDSEFMCTALKK